MYSQRISWFWPLSFLIALGQLLLLVTQNAGGPPFARLLLAAWTLWIPGVWLGNLLTKPRTGLPARLPLQVGSAMAVVYVMLEARAAGWLPADAAAFGITCVSAVIGLVFLLLPGNPGRQRRAARWEAREVRHAEPQVLAAFAILLAVTAILALAFGSPLSLRLDGVDQVGAARLAGSMTPGFPAPAYHEHLGLAGSDPHRSLAHGLVDMLARMSQLPHHRVWGLLPAVLAPLLLLSVYGLGRVLFRDENLAVASAFAYLLVTTVGFSNNELRLLAYPDRWALIPYWTAVALFIDGLDRPHPRIGIALGLVSLAVFGTHLGMGFILVLALLAIGTFTWLSVDRVIEGIPLLLVLWAPVVLLSGGYVLLRALLLGGLEPQGVPALGMLVAGPGRFALDAGQVPAVIRLAAVLGVVGLAAMLREAHLKISVYYFAAGTVLALVLGYVPWITPGVERGLGPIVHLLPRLCPLAWILVAVLAWAIRGLVRSEGHTWLRFLTVGLGIVVTIWLLIVGASSLAYAPGKLRGQRAAGPESLRPLADSLRVRVSGEPVVLCDAAGAAALAAYTPARSMFVPSDPRAPRAEAWRLYASAREALVPPANPSSVFDSLHVEVDRSRDVLAAFMDRHEVDLLVLPHRTAAAEWPGANFARGDAWLSRSGTAAWETCLDADMDHFERVDLSPLGAAYALSFAPSEAAIVPEVVGSPAPPRPPGLLRSPAPAIAQLLVDAARVAPGDTLVVRVPWNAPTSAGLDPRGYRLRVELVMLSEASSFWRALPRRAWRTMTGTWWERGGATGVEMPLAGGLSPAQWSGSGEETVRLPIPKWLGPGTYDLRARALPGALSADRVRGGASILPSSPQPVLVTVTARGR